MGGRGWSWVVVGGRERGSGGKCRRESTDGGKVWGYVWVVVGERRNGGKCHGERCSVGKWWGYVWVVVGEIWSGSKWWGYVWGTVVVRVSGRCLLLEIECDVSETNIALC